MSMGFSIPLSLFSDFTWFRIMAVCWFGGSCGLVGPHDLGQSLWTICIGLGIQISAKEISFVGIKMLYAGIIYPINLLFEALDGGLWSSHPDDKNSAPMCPISKQTEKKKRKKNLLALIGFVTNLLELLGFVVPPLFFSMSVSHIFDLTRLISSHMHDPAIHMHRINSQDVKYIMWVCMYVLLIMLSKSRWRL